MTQVTIGASTHTGQRKTTNEDSYEVVFPDGDSKHPGGILLILADGMGGMPAEPSLPEPLLTS